MNKKGVFLTTFEYIKMGFYTFIIIFYFFGIYMLVNYAVNREVDIGNIASEVYASRLLYSDSCLAFNDGIRTYVGVIDAKKFDNSRIDSCFTKKDFAAKISLTYNNQKKEVFNNEDSFVINNRLCFSNKYECRAYSQKYVAVAENGATMPGIIDMSVVYHVSE